MSFSEKGVPMDKKTLLENLRNFVDAITLFFGRHCEIAVHDLSQLESSLIHIAGTATGRKVGAPATDFLINHLAKYGDDVPDVPPYATRTADGHPLKSSLTFIRDAKRHPIIAICINYSIANHLNAIELIEEQVRMYRGSSDEDRSIETFASTSSETSEAIVKKVLRDFGKHPVDLNREERIALVCMFQQAGAFYFKGMVEHIAELMGISKYTLYNYKKLCGKNKVPDMSHD